MIAQQWFGWQPLNKTVQLGFAFKSFLFFNCPNRSFNDSLSIHLCLFGIYPLLLSIRFAPFHARTVANFPVTIVHHPDASSRLSRRLRPVPVSSLEIRPNPCQSLPKKMEKDRCGGRASLGKEAVVSFVVCKFCASGCKKCASDQPNWTRHHDRSGDECPAQSEPREQDGLQQWRRRWESNPGRGLCRPLPQPLGHVANRNGEPHRDPNPIALSTSFVENSVTNTSRARLKT